MAWFDVNTKDTLNARIREHYGEDECFSTIYDKKRCGGKIAVRRKQFQVAESGNVSMLIWLGKQWLGQTDKQEIEQKVDLKHERLLKHVETSIIEETK